MELEQLFDELFNKYMEQFIAPYKLKFKNNPRHYQFICQKEAAEFQKVKLDLTKRYYDFESKMAVAKNTIKKLIEDKISDCLSAIEKAEFDLLRQDAHKIKEFFIVGLLTEEDCYFLLFKCHIELDFWKVIQNKFFEPIAINGNSQNLSTPSKKAKKPDPTFLELFKDNETREDKFFALLKSQKVDALDLENRWIFNDRKSSIVACFDALIELEFIRKYKKAQLRRIIEAKIQFEGSERLFRERYNLDDYDFFFKLFEANL